MYALIKVKDVEINNILGFARIKLFGRKSGVLVELTWLDAYGTAEECVEALRREANQEHE